MRYDQNIRLFFAAQRRRLFADQSASASGAHCLRLEKTSAGHIQPASAAHCLTTTNP
ncbi:MAG: hypothetical protein ACOY32_11820 [Thermodesulfobacteriota bacterium]